LKRLAAYSRGIPGIAWALWRQSLLGEFNDELSLEEQQEFHQSEATTIWVRPWDDLEHPSLPSDFDRVDAFILHTLLLHGGLPAGLLTNLLSLSATELIRHLYHLQAAGLVEEDAERWLVSPLGYPVVRRFLDNAGYLTD
jgi:hypothetical protein